MSNDTAIQNPMRADFTVRFDHTDRLEHLAMKPVCNFLQEMAHRQADILGFSISQLMEQNITWMMIRLKVSLYRAIGWNEKLVLETWPSHLDKLYAYRDFFIKSPNHEILGAATSVWVMINYEKRVPIRISDYLKEVYSKLYDTAPEKALNYQFGKILFPESASISKPIIVRYSDLDVNGHVNNSSYIDYLLESVPDNYLERKSMMDLEIHYKNEALYGETLQSDGLAEEAGSDSLVWHRLVRSIDNKEIALAKTMWR